MCGISVCLHVHNIIINTYIYFYKRVNGKGDTNLKTKRVKFGNPTSVPRIIIIIIIIILNVVFS